MNISEILVAFDKINVGFDINKSEDKADMLMQAFDILENKQKNEKEINEGWEARYFQKEFY